MKEKMHLGQKLESEAKRLGIKPGKVAAFFGVKSPSVYDWYEHGRIHKRHYDNLVLFSGRPIQWWLDLAEPAETVPKTNPMDRPAVSPPFVSEQPAAYKPLSTFALAIGMMYDALPDDPQFRAEVHGEIFELLNKARRRKISEPQTEPAPAQNPKKQPV